MNLSTQNDRIAFLTEEWMLVGIDVGSTKHFARAFTNRKIELSKKPFEFMNTDEGFESFKKWIADQLKTSGLKYVMAGMEPTGHYWFNLAHFIKEHGMVVSHVNPAHVKKSKELDDTNPSKNDRKDPKTIAGLMADGRYTLPYTPENVYAQLRDLSSFRYRETEQLTRSKNLFARWISIHFPEYSSVYNDTLAAGGLMILKEAPLPEDILRLGAEGVNQIWRNGKLRGSGMKRAEKVVEAAEKSIGYTSCAITARLEIQDLLEDIERHSSRLEEIERMIEDALKEVPNVDKLLEIPGVGIKTVASFVAEIGDVSRFEDAKAIQKLSGLAIVADSSGKHNGQSSISYRGRKHLRYTMYLGAVSVICHNDQFAEIYQYYRERKNNPLKKLQAVIAVACKMIRVFYAILTKGISYDGARMSADIKRLAVQPV